jgi:hypothetical protein
MRPTDSARLEVAVAGAKARWKASFDPGAMIR